MAEIIFVEGYDAEYAEIIQRINLGMSKGWLQSFEAWLQMGQEEEARKKRATQLNRLIEMSRPRGFLEWLPDD